MAEVPDIIKLQQQMVCLQEEKMRLNRTAPRQDKMLMKITGNYKSTKFRIGQVEDQMHAIQKQLDVSDPSFQEIRMDQRP